MLGSSFHLQYPEMVVIRTEFGVGLTGIVQHQGGEYEVTVEIPQYPRWKCASLILNGVTVEEIPQELINPQPSLDCFFDRLRLLLPSLCPNRVNSVCRAPLPPAVEALRRHEELCRQLAVVGWHRVNWIDADVTGVTMHVLDRSARRHYFTMKLDSHYPNIPPVVSAELPAPIKLTWTKDCTLLDAYHQVSEAVDMYQSLWNTLDRLDELLLVLQPTEPRRCHRHRRILIEGGVSLDITLDPVSPTSVPVCRFLGPSELTSTLRERLSSNIDSWDEYDDITDNLERLLELEMVKKMTADGALTCSAVGRARVCCGICLCEEDDQSQDRNNSEAAGASAVVCEETRCNQLYHVSCLYQWLRSRVSARQTTSAICGECPYCRVPISCPIPSI